MELPLVVVVIRTRIGRRRARTMMMQISRAVGSVRRVVAAVVGRLGRVLEACVVRRVMHRYVFGVYIWFTPWASRVVRSTAVHIVWILGVEPLLELPRLVLVELFLGLFKKDGKLSGGFTRRSQGWENASLPLAWHSILYSRSC